MRTGDEVRTNSGRRLRVDGELPPGVQATPYRVTDLSTRDSGVLKVFPSPTPAGRRRLEALIEAGLHRVCSVLCAPTDLVTAGGVVGHVSALAPGRPLEQAQDEPGPFPEQLTLALALAHALDALHRRGWAHGDLHGGNIFVFRDATGASIYLIDFDNFAAARVPEPPCLGHALYMAPELRKAMADKRTSVVPDVRSDRFALTVVLHEIILLRHPAAGAAATDEAFSRAMCEGRWPDDPATVGRSAGVVGGYPVETLHADLARLFRRGFSLAPDERPSAGEWATTLRAAVSQVFACPGCSAPCLVDSSKRSCPACRAPYPTLTLVLPGGPVALAQASLPIGRDHLGGASHVSTRHAIFRRVGPDTMVESFGQNHTFRWTADGWLQIPDRTPVLIQAGDRLRFADVEVAIA